MHLLLIKKLNRPIRRIYSKLLLLNFLCLVMFFSKSLFFIVIFLCFYFFRLVKTKVGGLLMALFLQNVR